METLADFGRASGLLYDDVPRDGGPTRTLPTREGVLAGAIGALLLLIGLAALGLLAATLVNTEKLNAKPTRDTCSIERSLDGSLDDRCAPCEQANMQKKLDDFVYQQFVDSSLQLYGSFLYLGAPSMSIVDVPTAQDPMFPDTYQQTWDALRIAAEAIDTDLLDPYDAINFKYNYHRQGVYSWYLNQTTQARRCEQLVEDWTLPNSVLAPALMMFSAVHPEPTSFTTFGAWVIDERTFAYYVRMLEQTISAVQRRTAGDWWTAVHNRIVNDNSDILRTAFVNNHLNAIAAELALVDPLAMPQPIVAYITDSGYTMSPAETARLFDVIERYYNAQLEFFFYSLATAPPLSNPLVFNTWALTYGWTACFGYENGLWYYGTNHSELMAMFLDNKAWTEQLVAQLQVTRDALWPADAWMPWQDTWLHYAYPAGSPNPLNITGWAMPADQCLTNPATGAPYFVDTLARDTARYYNEHYKLYNAAEGSTPTVVMTLQYGGCAPFAGNAGTTVRFTPPSNQFVTPPTLIMVGPTITLNDTISAVVHEMKHSAQVGMLGASACPTCYGNFITTTMFSIMPGATNVPFTVSDFNGLAFVEGPAVFSEEMAIEQNMLTQWEAFHDNMTMVQIRQMYIILTTGIRLGYWDLAGAMAWMNTYSWFPSQIPASAIAQGALREMIPSAGWYGIGWWYTRMYNAMAKAACGSAFNQQAFNQLTHTIPIGPISMWRTLLDNYIANNCTSPTTRFGDARRTVVAPSLRGM